MLRVIGIAAILMALALVNSAFADTVLAEQAERGMVTIRLLKVNQLSRSEKQERFKTGMSLVQGAAEQGNTRAMIFLADRYADGLQGWNGPLLEKDVGKAAGWARKALAAADIDTINQYPPVRQRMQVILSAAAEKVKQDDTERQRQEEARRRDAENAKAEAAWRADAPRREAEARRAQQERQARLAAWQSKPLSERRHQCEITCQGTKSACEFGNTLPHSSQSFSIMSGDFGGALFHGAMKKDCGAAVQQCQETCLETGN